MFKYRTVISAKKNDLTAHCLSGNLVGQALCGRLWEEWSETPFSTRLIKFTFIAFTGSQQIEIHLSTAPVKSVL